MCGYRSNAGKTSSPLGAVSSEGTALYMYVDVRVSNRRPRRMHFVKFEAPESERILSLSLSIALPVAYKSSDSRPR